MAKTSSNTKNAPTSTRSVPAAKKAATVKTSSRPTVPPPQPAPAMRTNAGINAPMPSAAAMAQATAQANVANTQKAQQLAALQAAQAAAAAQTAARSKAAASVGRGTAQAAEPKTAGSDQAIVAALARAVQNQRPGTGSTTTTNNVNGIGTSNAPSVTSPSAGTGSATTPVVAPVAPPQTASPVGGTPSDVKTFTSSGTPGTYGGFQRQRQNRGPQTGLSVTPEMLRRIAQQRLTNQF